MKNIVIAAGYATRLGELTRNFPKPLLKIGNKNILEMMLDDIDGLEEVTEHIIVTNHRFAPIFNKWAKEMNYNKPIRIIDDGTETNETRLGAVKDIIFAIEKLDIDEDILVVAADNILLFSFKDFIGFAGQKKTSCIMCHEQNDTDKLRRTGVVEVDDNMKVIGLEEKPLLPKSNLAVPPFYYYRQDDLDILKNAVSNGCGTDAPGNLAIYMSGKVEMHAWRMNGGRFDIGSIDTYKEACLKFGNQTADNK
ncbi:MAG: nucleotidyltransferase family protein [Prevotella sp.]